MPVLFKNYSASSVFDGGVSERKTLLSGASGGTIVKSLELVNSTNASCNVNVYRQKQGAASPYADVSVELKANDYLVLWEGFFVIEASETLSFQANATGVTAVASVVEMS